MLKKIFLLLLLLFVSARSVSAFTLETFVTFANPVRGEEGWILKNQKPLDLPKHIYLESSPSALPQTWMLRYDVVTSATMSAFFDYITQTNPTQTLGAYLEVTPKLAEKSQVWFPSGLFVSAFNQVMLSNYTTTDRLKIIDTYMNAYFERFGTYPRSVFAKDLDSFSLRYLQSKYSLLIAMNYDEQYNLGQGRLWGGYLGSPYYPDKNNSLIPAKEAGDRINLPIVRWNQKDFVNYTRSDGHLFGVNPSSYLQAGQGIDYFNNLLSSYEYKKFNEFTYLNIGFENDLVYKTHAPEILKSYDSVKKFKNKYTFRYLPLAEFGDWFKSRYPEGSPAFFFAGTDPAGFMPNYRYYLYQSPFYRILLKSYGGRTEIVDLRIYNRQIYEDFLDLPNHTGNHFHEIPAVIDAQKNPGTEIVLKNTAEDWKVEHSRVWENMKVSIDTNNKKILFEPDRIIFTNLDIADPGHPDIKVTQSKDQIIWTANPQTPAITKSKLSFIGVIITALIILSVLKKNQKGGFKPPKHLVVGVLIVLLSGLTMYRSGSLHSFGLGYWGPNGHDAFFHLSLIEKFAREPFTLSHPQLAGEKIQNYHLAFDYLSGLIVRLTGITASDWYFILFPLLAGLYLVFLLDKLFSKLGLDSKTKSIAFILVFLAGSFGFIPKILTGQDIFAGESAFWANQSVSLFLNPPYTLSLLLLLLFLVKFETAGLISLAVIGGLLSQTKVYAFILLLGALLMAKKFKHLFAVLTVGTLLTIPFLSSSAGFPFQFSPLWFPKSLFASFDRFYWPKFISAWQTYEIVGNFPKLILLNLFALISFYLGNLGIRLFGLLRLSSSKPKSDTEKLIYWLIIFGLLIPLVFVQKINPWNTIQFMYYSLFFLGILTAVFLSHTPKAVLIPLILIGIFTSFGTLKDYIGKFSSSRISHTELQAINKLRAETGGVVVSPLYYLPGSRSINAPKPLYSYTSTAYISALSGQKEFLSDTINLDITGYNYQSRAKDVQRLYRTADAVWAKKFLQDNQIDYVYTTPLEKIHFNPDEADLHQIFESGEITIYKFK